MRNILLAIVMAILPATMAVADPPVALKLEKPTPPTKLLPVKGASVGNSCASYGPGFRKVEGTDTCVKVGGAVSVEVGGSR
jgi:hypothetical protein